MKIFRVLNEHSMAAPCKKLTMSRGDDGDAGGMVLEWPVLRGDGCARCGVLTWERWHGEGGEARATRVHGWGGYHQELPPGWGYHQAGTRDEGVVHRRKNYASGGGKIFFVDFTGYIPLF